MNIHPCPRCKNNLPLDKFYIRRGNKPSSYCKTCTTKVTVERQIANKTKAVEYMGRECTKCNYKKYFGALEFHHLDPTKKDLTIGKMRLRNFDKIKQELDKCVLVCSRCHKIEHFIQAKHRLAEARRFTINPGDITKPCKSCSTTKPIRLFYKNRTTGKYFPYCISCTKDQVTKRQNIAKDKALAISGKKCVFCGFDDYLCALEFHHKDPEQKDFEISKNALKNFDLLIPEIEKCITVCSCCHREIHAGIIDLTMFQYPMLDSNQQSTD
jgi:5-methylcytosine-specific restriction endonuclease McrA